MSRFGREALSVTDKQFSEVQSCFSSASVDDDQTCAVIAQVKQDIGKLLDPHSAVGVKAARDCNNNTDIPMITLATAHPAKFADAIAAAGLETPELPSHLKDLFQREEHFSVVNNSLSEVTEFVASHARK